jgi:hypothetical protein
MLAAIDETDGDSGKGGDEREKCDIHKALHGRGGRKSIQAWLAVTWEGSRNPERIARRL